jgi:GT2 family glycosyltransferase
MADFHNGTTQMHGLEDVELSGAGCVLLSRKVCEKMHPLWRWDIDKKDGMPAQGDDFAFCRRARRLGFKVWCAWDYPCQHFRGEVDMLSLLLGHHNQMRLQKTEQEKTRILVP